MGSWSLAIEPGHAYPASYVSDNGGQTWRNHRMRYLNVERGEYVIRLRTAEGDDPPAPLMTWERLRNPRVEALKRLGPNAAREPSSLLERVRARTTWLSSSWEHTPPPVATQ